MNTEAERRAGEIFRAALETTSAAQRAELIRRACGEDVELRQEVEALLACDARSSSFLDPQRTLTLDTTHLAPAAVGRDAPEIDSFAGYKLLGEIHRGGQGVVYQALQTSTHRKVAIKVALDGAFADVSDRARFEREASVLARLKHPNIVAIHDRGVAGGRDYFVMDYVSGEPLDVHVAGKRLSVRATIELLAKICDAVAAAHVRGIIHRDLKPGNIRVDDAGEPFVLDFGLAKVVDDRDPAMTRAGQFLGSRPWASPEQAEGDPAKIDLRTDVYALGVVLFQVLTGCFPYDVSGPHRQVLERILTAAPVRPRTLRREIDDEVETIVLRCLAKEPERRYQSAGELSRDLRRYLRGEPVEAKRDSTAYLIRKTLWRHRIVFGAAAALFIALAGGAVTATVFWLQAAAQREIAIQENARANAEARLQGVVSAFLGNLLRYVDPTRRNGQTLTLREVLDAAARHLDAADGEFADEPAVRARVKGIVGDMYLSLGEYSRAVDHLRGAIDLDAQVEQKMTLRAADLATRLADGLVQLHRPDEAIAPLRDALAVYRAASGGEDEAAAALNVLAGALESMGRTDEAIAMTREARQLLGRLLGDNDPDVRQSSIRLAGMLHRKGLADEAEALYLDVLGRFSAGEAAHPDRTTAERGLALLEIDSARLEAAERRLREVRSIELDGGAPETLCAATLVHLGLCLNRRGAGVAAEPLLREALEIRARVYGDDSWFAAVARGLLGESLTLQMRLVEAEPLLVASQAVLERERFLPARLRIDAAERLASYFDVAERSAEAARWHAVADALRASGERTDSTER